MEDSEIEDTHVNETSALDMLLGTLIDRIDFLIDVIVPDSPVPPPSFFTFVRNGITSNSLPKHIGIIVPAPRSIRVVCAALREVLPSAKNSESYCRAGDVAALLANSEDGDVVIFEQPTFEGARVIEEALLNNTISLRIGQSGKSIPLDVCRFRAIIVTSHEHDLPRGASIVWPSRSTGDVKGAGSK